MNAPDRWQSAEALEAMRQLGRNPRRFRRLLVQCANSRHELCSIYETVAGPVITGEATALPSTGAQVALTHVGIKTTQLVLSLRDYAVLMYVTRAQSDVDAEGHAAFIGSSFGIVVSDSDSDLDYAAHVDATAVALLGFDVPLEEQPQYQDWLVYFRCRCSQAHISPAWLAETMPTAGPTRRVVAPVMY